MNTFEFFNANFGRHLVTQVGEPHEAAAKALSVHHPLASGKACRLNGWAIIKPDYTMLQMKLAVPSIHYYDLTRYEAILHELENWSRTPTLFMVLDLKKPMPIANMFLTVDLRAVRICTPKGVETFDYTQEPTERSPNFDKRLIKQRNSDVS